MPPTCLSERLASRPLVVRSRPEVVERITLSIGAAVGTRTKAVPSGMRAPMWRYEAAKRQSDRHRPCARS
jgi:hypothetical protein